MSSMQLYDKNKSKIEKKVYAIAFVVMHFMGQ